MVNFGESYKSFPCSQLMTGIISVSVHICLKRDENAGSGKRKINLLSAAVILVVPFGNFTQNTARNADRHHIGRDIVRHHAARANHAVLPNGYTGKNN